MKPGAQKGEAVGKLARRASAATASLALLCSCAADLSVTQLGINGTSAGAISAQNASLSSVKVIFHYSDFYTLDAPNPNSQCAGDAKTFYNPLSGSALTALGSDATITQMPAFINNVSVDITNANQVDTHNMSYNCSYKGGPGALIPAYCATFDYTPASFSSSLFTGYATGFYSFFDNQCINEGPIATPDPTQNKLEAGGVYFDLNRSALGPNENLLLDIIFFPMDPTYTEPAGLGSGALGPTEDSIFEIHLVSTGQGITSLQDIFQPRYLTYLDDSETYPELAQKISIIAPPTGEIREEQVLIPLSMNPAIDRIRLERYSGSGVLVEARLYRMGYR